MLRSAALVFAGVLVAKLCGFLEKLLIAAVFGIQGVADAYFAATALVWALYLFFRELLEPSFLAPYVRSIARGHRGDQAGLLQLVFGGGVFTSGCLVIGLIANPLRFSRALAPGLDATVAQQMSEILECAAPGALFLVASSVCTLALQARERFGPPALGEVMFKLMLVATVAGVGVAGVGPRFLGIGLSGACLARLIVQAIALRSELGRCLRGWKVTRAQAKQMGSLGLPVVVGAAFAQFSELADTWFASDVGAGSIAARGYAKKLTDLPILLVPAVWSIVLYPRLARLWAFGESSTFSTTLARSIRWVCMAFVPLAIWCFLFAESLVKVVFGRGAFDPNAVSLTTTAARVYAIGMPVFAVEALVIPAFFARLDTRTPIIAGVLGVGVNVLALWLLTPVWGLAGVAAAPVLSKTLKLAGVASWIRFRWKLRIGLPVVPLGVAVVLAAGVALTSTRYALPQARNDFEVFAISSATLVVTMVVFVGTCLLSCAEQRREFRDFRTQLRTYLQRRKLESAKRVFAEPSE